MNKEKQTINYKKLSWQLIQFIDPIPFERNNTECTFADITSEFSDQKEETTIDKNGYKLIKIHIDVKNIIQKLDNYAGTSAIIQQLKQTLEENYAPDIWNNWNYFNPKELKKVQSPKIKSFLTNLYKIKEYNCDFYESLYLAYIDIISNLTDHKEMASRISKLQNKVSEFESMFDKQIIYIENEIKKNVYSEFITILGIFTAITFAIFGGMNLLNDLFKNIGSTQASLGQTLILAAIFGLFMWGITELLFYWISKIKGITDSTKDKNKILFNRSALIVIVSILSLGVLLFTYTIK